MKSMLPPAGRKGLLGSNLKPRFHWKGLPETNLNHRKDLLEPRGGGGGAVAMEGGGAGGWGLLASLHHVPKTQTELATSHESHDA